VFRNARINRSFGGNSPDLGHSARLPGAGTDFAFLILEAGIRRDVRMRGSTMRWSMFGRGEPYDARTPDRAETGKGDHPGIEEALEARGLTPDFSRAMAARIEPRLAALSPEQQEAMLDGVALASALHRETSRELESRLQGLREVERMMGAFSGELSKLDEVLEVLAAYVQRMRSSGGRDTAQTLH